MRIIVLNLTIDIGNTQTKLGFFDGLDLKSVQKLSSVDNIPWQSIIDTNKITHSIVSQVGNVQSDLETLHNNTQYVEVHHQLQLPFTSDYDPFTNLGIDRVVGLAAATYLFPLENILIIDAGTCITYDLITSKGIAEPLAGFLLASAIICLIVGSVVFVLGANTRLGASLLLVFLVPTTLIFHTFPVDSGFFMNLALIGALLLALTRSSAGAVPSFRWLRQR